MRPASSSGAASVPDIRCTKSLSKVSIQIVVDILQGGLCYHDGSDVVTSEPSALEAQLALIS